MENNFENLNGKNSEKNFHELLVCVDRVDGSLEFFDHNQNCWQKSSISLKLSPKQLLCEVQWLQNENSLFAFGGRNLGNNPLNLVWSRNLSDVSSQWTAMAPMSKNRSNFSSVVFDNNIYALGGNLKDYYSGNRILCSCESYDIQQKQWKTIDSLKIARKNASAAIYNNCIYIAGGSNEKNKKKVTERSVEKYDFQSQTWSKVASMKTARSHFALTPFGGRLWAIGGMGGDNQALSSVETYNFKSNRWKKEKSLSSGRIGHSAIEFNGELYVVGGFKKVIKNAIKSYVSKPTKITENYVSGKGWSENFMLQKTHPFVKLIIAYNINIKNITVDEQKNTKINNRSLNNLDQLKNNNDTLNETNKLILPKFENELKKYAAEVQLPLKKVSESTITSGQTFLLPEEKDKPSQQLLVNESISLLKIGHFVTKNAKQLLVCIDDFHSSVEFYDPQHKSWHSSPVSLSLPNEQRKFELALLGNVLYAFGGININNNKFNVTNLMWSRDLSNPSSQWTASANMKQGRREFCSVVLNDTIYILGGENYLLLLSCERYCSQLNEWSTVADMDSKRVDASAAVINGCIYVAGGWGEKGVLKSVSKYCPETDTWREVTSMTTERRHFALTPFAGRLWAIGGKGGDRHPLSSCESYDPVTDTWRKEAPMKEERCEHAAIELNGELYVVGGRRSGDPTTAIEKYVPTTGWVEDSQLQKTCTYPQLLIIPPAYSSYFTNRLKKLAVLIKKSICKIS